MLSRITTGLALSAVAATAAHAAARRVGRTWGATLAEAERPLPGDDLVPDADAQVTMAVSIDAPPERVWPWLLQMGVDRAGLYTHTWVENGLFRLRVQNAGEIRPEWQDLKVGDHIWFVPEGYPTPRFGPRVVAIEPSRHLVCALGDDPDRLIGTWQFILTGGDATRLLFRSRAAPSRPAGMKVVDALLEPGYLYMNAGMLRGIANRATGDPLSLPPVAEPPARAPDGMTLRALVAVASPQGSTTQVGRAIAGELRRAGITANLRDVGDVTDIEGYDAVVVGSAIHSHYWMHSAAAFVDQHREALKERPVWLFSTGMLTIDTQAPWPEPYPKGMPELAASVNSRGHRLFTGRRDLPEPKPVWTLFGRLAVWAATRKTPVPEGYTLTAGDYRDWPAIHGWARAIAATLRAEANRSTAERVSA